MGNSANEKILHLHKIIDTIRDVNRILISAKSPDELLSEVCKTLENTRGYRFAFAALLNKYKGTTQIFDSGNSDEGNLLKQNLQEGHYPDFIHEVIQKKKVSVLTEKPTGIDFEFDFSEHSLFISPIIIDNDQSGFLCVAVHINDAKHPKEETTVIDIANNIGYALAKINQKEKNAQNELRYQTLINSLSDALFIIQNDKIEFVNPKLCELIEYKEEELIGKDLKVFVAPEEKEKIEAYHTKRMRGEDAPSTYESVTTTKSGKKLPVQVSVTEIDYKEQMAYQVILTDISSYKATIEELKESEEYFRFLSESSFEGIIIHDNGVILDVNESTTRLSGYSREELIGKNLITDLISAEDREIIAQSLQHPQSGPFIIKGLRKNKQEGYAEIEARDIYFKGKKVRVAAVRDVSERYILQEEIKEGQEKLNRLLGNLPGVAYNCKNNENWDMNFLSEGCFNLLGYHPQELLNGEEVSYADLIHTDDRDYVWETIQNAVHEKESFELEYRIITKSKTEKWVWERGRSVENDGDIILEGFISDITQRKKAAEALQESEHKYRLLFNSINDAIFIHPFANNAETNFTEVNNAATQLFGYTHEEFMELTPRDLVPAEHRNAEAAGLFLQNLKENHWAAYETIGRSKQGKDIDIEISSQVFELGNQQMILSLIRDITERKTAQSKIIENEQRYRAVFENTGAATCILEEDGTISLANNEFAKLSGFKLEEIENQKKWMEFVHPEDLERMKEQHRLRRENDEVALHQYQFRFLDKENNLKHINLIVDVIPGTKKSVSSLIDVTQIINFEQQLIENNKQLSIEKDRAKKEQEKYQELFSNSASVMLLIEPETGDIVDANRTACAFYKYTYEELTALNITSINTLTLPEIKVEIQKCLTNHVNTFEFKHRLADGTFRDVETHSGSVFFGERRLLYSIIHDITQRKTLENTNKMLSQAMNSSPVSIVITNVKGEIEYVNPFFEQKTGYSKEEALGQNPSILKSDKQPESFYKELWSTILSGKSWSGEFLNKKKSGETYWENSNISPVFNNQGEIVHFVAVKEDVTEKKQTLQELKAAKEKAEESDKLKSSFLANMSHEIRTPMNGILGFTELLKDPDLSGEKQNEFIDIIQTSGERMLSTINDIIDISKIESGLVQLQLQDINLSALINEIHEFYTPLMQNKGLSFTVNENNGNPVHLYHTDPDKLNSILTNLIKNAFKFTAEGGISFGYQIKGKEIHFYVEDTGVGIPSDRQKAIFERFVQADIADSRVFEGSGLGLAITKSYTEMFNGTIHLESEIGKGTRFSVHIPFNQEVATHTTSEIEKSTIHKMEITNKIRILIAEDDPVSVELLKLIVTSISSEIIVVENGKDAVETMQQRKDIDLVLMDIKMPIMDGFTSTQEIRKFNGEVKIIAQTAFAQNEDGIKALKSGCDDFITKPINRDLLLECIENLFDDI